MAPVSPPLVSIVIPVYRDTRELTALLAGLSPAAAGPVEVIVVNGDPGDGTLDRLRSAHAAVRWIDSEPGRGRQMNAGAQAAAGRWLLFLHADARLDDRWAAALETADARPEVVGGAFRLTIASPRRIARVIEGAVATRVRWWRLPYGDQGIFVRTEAFDRLGGYAAWPLMEDIDFIRRLRTRGELWFPAVPVEVSARRWERDGWVRRTVSNVALAALYFLGMSPRRLGRWYYGTAPPAAPAPAARRRPGPRGRVTVIVPAFNEEDAVAGVVATLPAGVDEVVVVDNGSTDATAARARQAGATVVPEPRRGYGAACLAGLARVRPDDEAIVVFLDADQTDDPDALTALIAPIREGVADIVLGDRGRSGRPWHARFGTDLCVWLINRRWGTRYRDLGPFRAIGRRDLDRLGMADRTWGWTIEMQIKAAEAGLVVREVPVRQRPRVGTSKISGTVAGSVRAGTRMLYTIWRLRRRRC